MPVGRLSRFRPASLSLFVRADGTNKARLSELGLARRPPERSSVTRASLPARDKSRANSRATDEFEEQQEAERGRSCQFAKHIATSCQSLPAWPTSKLSKLLAGARLPAYLLVRKLNV